MKVAHLIPYSLLLGTAACVYLKSVLNFTSSGKQCEDFYFSPRPCNSNKNLAAVAVMIIIRGMVMSALGVYSAVS